MPYSHFSSHIRRITQLVEKSEYFVEKWNRMALMHYFYSVKKWMKILLQGLLLLVVIYCTFPIRVGYSGIFREYHFLSVSMIILKVIMFYTNYLLLFPKLFERKKYWQWVVAIVGLFIGVTFLRYLSEEVIAYKLWHIHNYFWPIDPVFYFLDNVQWFFPWFLLSTLIKLVQMGFRQEKEKEQLMKQKYMAEISFLRSQVNPHFLFNALNSIYSLSRRQSEYAPDAVMKLSEIMRYMLEESNMEKVPLEKEVRYIVNYIALQKLRYKEKENIVFDLKGTPDHQSIAPLLLIPFIENTFKHGSAKDPDNPITIQLELNEQHVSLFTKNKKNKGDKDRSTGIGLGNVKKRLELQYSGKYLLEIKDNENSYQTHLHLTLA